MRISNNYKIVWPKNSYINCSFNDLFINKIELKNTNIKKIKRDLNIEKYSSWRFIIIPEDKIDYPIDFLYNKTPEILQKIYLEKINILKPIKYISSQIQNFSKNFDDKTVTVSIRSWNNKEHKSSLIRSKSFDINYFINEMKKLKNVSKFFITTDNIEIIKKLKSVFPNRILVFPNRTMKGDFKTIKGMQDILIDLYLGGQNNRLIVSSISTFSELQWWFGGCKSEVLIVKSCDPKNKNKEILKK